MWVKILGMIATLAVIFVIVMAAVERRGINKAIPATEETHMEVESDTLRTDIMKTE